MALLLDGKNQNLKRKNFIDFGKRFGVPEKALQSMLDTLIKRFTKNYPTIFSVPAANKKKKFLQQMFKQRTQHVSMPVF